MAISTTTKWPKSPRPSNLKSSSAGLAPIRVSWISKKFREIADSVGALLLGDMAHVAGLIVAGEYPNPFPYCDVVTSTTHKTLRGPRGGIILTNNEEIAKKINKAVFPGTQGGPLVHVVAAKAVGFGENLKPEWKTYAKQVKANARSAGRWAELAGL